MGSDELMQMCDWVFGSYEPNETEYKIARALKQTLLKEQKQWPRYACHCDLEPHMEPDRCVLDDNKPEDCIYARGVVRDHGGDKTKCEYWLPVVKKV